MTTSIIPATEFLKGKISKNAQRKKFQLLMLSIRNSDMCKKFNDTTGRCRKIYPFKGFEQILKIHGVVSILGGAENNHGKVNILLQSYVNRIRITSFSLTSDQLYVSTNASRIARALFEIAVKNNWANAASRLLSICKCTEQRLWEQQHPLRQLPSDLIREEHLMKLERSNLSLEKLIEMPAPEISSLLRLNPMQGKHIKELARSLPAIKVEASVQPITRTVLRVKVSIYPLFTWMDKVSGPSSEPWWLWVEDPESNYIYHNEYVTLSKKQVVKRNASRSEPHEVVFTIPIHEPLPTQYLLRVESDRLIFHRFRSFVKV